MTVLFASAYWFLMSLKKDLHSSGFCYWVVDYNEWKQTESIVVNWWCMCSQNSKEGGFVQSGKGVIGLFATSILIIITKCFKIQDHSSATNTYADEYII